MLRCEKSWGLGIRRTISGFLPSSNDIRNERHVPDLLDSRAAYYSRVNKMEQPDAYAERLEWVQEAYQASRRTYGYRRIVWWISKNEE